MQRNYAGQAFCVDDFLSSIISVIILRVCFGNLNFVFYAKQKVFIDDKNVHYQ